MRAWALKHRVEAARGRTGQSINRRPTGRAFRMNDHELHLGATTGFHRPPALVALEVGADADRGQLTAVNLQSDELLLDRHRPPVAQLGVASRGFRDGRCADEDGNKLPPPQLAARSFSAPRALAGPGICGVWQEPDLVFPQPDAGRVGVWIRRWHDLWVVLGDGGDWRQAVDERGLGVSTGCTRTGCAPRLGEHGGPELTEPLLARRRDLLLAASRCVERGHSQVDALQRTDAVVVHQVAGQRVGGLTDNSRSPSAALAWPSSARPRQR